MIIARLENVRKIYRLGGQEMAALDGVSLQIEEGEFAAIVGPSGSGKSTLMHLLGCLDTPTSGRLEICGRDVTRVSREELARIRNRDIGFVFQSFNLLPRLNVVENIGLPLVYAGVPGRLRHQRATAAAEQLGLGERLSHRPTQLSGGQCQRVAIARAIVNDPRILLADEPTGNLDSVTGAAVLDIFRDLHRKGKTLVLVTHDRDVAAVAHRRIEIRDGRIASDIRP